MRFKFSMLNIFCLVAFLCAPVYADYTLYGKSKYVIDGDTFVLSDVRGGEGIKMRLAGIDAPETTHGRNIGQPFSVVAKDSLSEMIRGKDLRCVCADRDRFGRDLCTVYSNELNVNENLVMLGMAWTWPEKNISSVYLRLTALEKEARVHRRGLWGEGRVVAPWVWRKSCWKDGRCDVS